MNIQKLEECKKILEIELSNNIKSLDKCQKIYQTRLSFLIDDLRGLISLQNNPKLHDHISKLCNPEK